MYWIVIGWVIFVSVMFLVCAIIPSHKTVKQEKSLRELKEGDYLFTVECSLSLSSNWRICPHRIEKIKYEIKNGKVVRVIFYLPGQLFGDSWDLSNEYVFNGYYSSYNKAKSLLDERLREAREIEFKKQVEEKVKVSIIEDFKKKKY